MTYGRISSRFGVRGPVRREVSDVPIPLRFSGGHHRRLLGFAGSRRPASRVRRTADRRAAHGGGTAFAGSRHPDCAEGRARRQADRSEPVAPNPYLANLPDPRSADYSAWNTRLSQQSRQRAKSSQLSAAKRQAAARRLPPAVVHDEEEPAGTVGANDSQPNAEPVSGFGTGPGENNRVRVLGELADLTPAPSTRVPGAEDNGQLSLATATLINGSGAIRTTGVLGDGPHGPPPAGDGTNDFDFYRLTSAAGRTLTVDTSGSPIGSDTYVAVYSAAGQLLATDDDGGTTGLASLLRYQLPADGVYFVLVAGYATLGRTLPQDPNNSGSGRGGGDTGDYTVLITAAEVDVDFFAFDLAAGDVIGATVSGGATELTVYRLDGDPDGRCGGHRRGVGAVPGGVPAARRRQHDLRVRGRRARQLRCPDRRRRRPLRRQGRGVPAGLGDRPGRERTDGVPRLRRGSGQHRDLGRARGTGALALLGVHRQVGPDPCPGGGAGRPASPRRSRRTSGPT